MSWNYRLVKATYNKGTENEEVYFEIREAYYNDDGSIWAMTEEKAGIFGESPEEAEKVLERMSLAFHKEVIDLDTFVFAPHHRSQNQEVIDLDLDDDEFDKQFSAELKDLDSSS